MDMPTGFFRCCLPAVAAAAGLLFALPPQAARSAGLILVQADGITVRDAWARASAGGATTGAAYITVTGGSQADQLIAARTPVATKAEVHQTFTENGVMKMRAVPGLAVPAGETVAFGPGGTHIMLMGLKQPLSAGQSFPLTLTFAHAAAVTVDVTVQPIGRTASPGDHGSMQMR